MAKIGKSSPACSHYKHGEIGGTYELHKIAGRNYILHIPEFGNLRADVAKLSKGMQRSGARNSSRQTIGLEIHRYMNCAHMTLRPTRA